MLSILGSVFLLVCLFPYSSQQKTIEVQTPQDATALYREGVKFYQREKYAEAVEVLQQAIREKGKQQRNWEDLELRDTYLKIATAYSMMGNHDQAFIFFSSYLWSQKETQEIVTLDKNSAQVYYDLGTAYYTASQLPSDHRFASAVACFQRAIRLKPTFAAAYEYLGFSYDAQHQYENAIEAYQMAIFLDPTRAAAYNSLGDAYRLLKRYRDAIEPLQRAIVLKPEFVAPQHYLLLTYIDLGDKKAALRQYRVLKKLHKESAEETWPALLELLHSKK